LRQSLKRFRKGISHHIGRIDTSADTRVQMHGHHTPQTRPVAGQQLLGGRSISGGDLLQELVRVWVVSWH
jgi:hypothetical protein